MASSRVVVGRAPERDVVRLAVDEAVAGRGGLVLLAGEPGIGKTWLAEEMADYGRSRGAKVAWGRCWEGDGAPGFWPWVQVIRSLVKSCSSAALSQLDIDVGEISRLLPAVKLLNDPPIAPHGGPDSARFRLFEAIAGLLTAASERRPVVVILDDLQWSDAPSLSLLRFLARELRGCAVAIMGTYRDVEVAPTHPLAALVGELTGECRHVQLRGLGELEVAELVASITDVELTPDTAAVLHRATNGNPFFVREVVYFHTAPGPMIGQLESAPGGEMALPGGVQAVIRRRVQRLPVECAQLLEAAAVLGQTFDVALLGVVADRALDVSVRLLAEAVRARLLRPSPGEPARLEFAHDLTRETLYAELPTARRVALHARCAAAIEERFATDLDPWLGEVAEHLWQAGTDPIRAADYAARAGQQAMAALAYEEAARQLARAVRILESTAPGERIRRCDLLLLLGQAQMSAASPEVARATFQQAALLADQADLPDRVAQAALAVGVEYTFGVVDAVEVGLLERALRGLPDHELGLKARILARLAKALLFTPDLDRRALLSAQAVRLAEDSADPAVLGWVLFDRHIAIWESATPLERLEIATEIVRLARRCSDRALEFRGCTLRIANLLELADIAGYQTEIHHLERLIAEHRLVGLSWHVPLLRATQALIAGRFAEVEQLAATGLAMGHRVEQPSVELWHTAIVATAKVWQGRAAEAEPLLRAVADTWLSVPAFSAAWTVVLAETGRAEQARVEFERLAAADFALIPRDMTWLISLGTLAATCHCLDDRPRARVLYDLLLPHAPYLVRVNQVGIACSAPVAYYLGVLALTLGHLDAAETHLRDAITIGERIGAPVFAANARSKLADCLATRGRPEDDDRSIELRRNADTILRGLGIRPILQPRAAPAAATPRPEPAVLRLEGDYWEIGYDGRSARVRNSVGLRYLSRLLAEPRREFHCLDLAAGGSSRNRPVASNLGPILDDRAKAAYRQRLTELTEDLAEAEEFGDNDRTESVRGQIDALTDQLTAAVGLGGRDRHTGSDAERARTAVTKAIKAALARIAAHNPILGEHLAGAIHTGTYCTYLPDPTTLIAWNR